MNKADKDLKNLLDGTGVKPHNPLDEKFDNPMGQLDDLFENFAKIFAPKPFLKDQQKNIDEAKKRKEDEDDTRNAN